MLIESETSRLVDIFAYVVGKHEVLDVLWCRSAAKTKLACQQVHASDYKHCLHLPACNLPRVCKPQYHQFCVVSVPCRALCRYWIRRRSRVLENLKAWRDVALFARLGLNKMKSLSASTVNLTRLLHCFQRRASCTPYSVCAHQNGPRCGWRRGVCSSQDLNNPKEKKEELNPSRPQTLLGAWDKCFVLCCSTLRIARRSEELYQDENKQEPELRFFASVLGPSW